MSATRTCTCGRPITDAEWRAAVHGYQVVPPAIDGRPGGLLELSTPCVCGSTLTREVEARQDPCAEVAA